MAFTVYQTNKKTGTVYAYSQENYRDPVTKFGAHTSVE